MADYISRDAVMELRPKDIEIIDSSAYIGVDELLDLVGEIPAADVEPVVRCRECRYYAASGATTSFCIHPGGMKFTSDSDYCSRGKRRDQSADVRNIGQFAGGGKTGGPNDADQH